ncbi:hypothetical protein LXL04_004020 [Taraxacum kok-saghyz]
MHGQPPRFSRHGGGRGQPPPQQPFQPFINPNYLQNNNYYLQPPNFPMMFPNFPVETSNIHTQNLNLPIGNPNFITQNLNISTENPNFHMQNHRNAPHNQLAYNRVVPHNGANTIEKIDKAVIKARRELIAAGQNVSALKVSQAALVVLQADSWDSLGVQMQHVPCLYRLMLIEGKINAFIHCFVEVWKITTLSDLETAICKNEGVQQFEELELGPLIRHPLINHYFCVSSDSTAVFKISGREILSFLVEYMDAHKGKEVKADELLDFIAKKRSVDSKEKLHVRIQSLGMHIAIIRQAKPMENATVKRYLESSAKKSKNRPLFTSQKKQMEESFGSISQRIKAFSSGNGKHIRFLYSSEDDEVDVESDDNEDENETCLTSQSKNSSQSKKSADRVSTCPYPSASEEKTRLGIHGEKEEIPNEGVKSSNKKRKSDELNCTDSRTYKIRKRDGDNKVSDEHIADTLKDDSMMAFITLWKEACKRKKPYEVFNQMLQFYEITKKSKVKWKAVHKVCQTYPVIGLLNVAIRSIKHGMWDSIYDNLQTSDHEETSKDSEDNTDNVTIETEQANSKHISKQHCEVSLEDILKKGSEFFKDNQETFFKSLYKCEVFLTQQFAVENFEALGHGGFLTFLERNISLLPPSFQKIFLSDVTPGKPSLDAYMSHQLLDMLIAQASLQNENLTIQNVVELLTSQFPLIPFKLDDKDSSKALEDVVNSNKSNPVSKSLLFSAALLSPSMNTQKQPQTHVSSKDAVEVLIRAPMLTDLRTWSHWDLLFAPFLGPLSSWLINEIKPNELLCLVTRSGNVIRIDHTSTVDSFLEASIRGSSFQTAVNLLSLFALYGGEKNVPSSLLKLHAEKAFKVITASHDSSKDKIQHNTASNFVLDCLTYLPVEFRSFATDVLLSGFRSIVKDAPSVILKECRNADHRVMLHELGFSLGIMEWIEDHRIFSVSGSIKSSESDQTKEDVSSTSSTPAEGKKILSTKGKLVKEDSKVIDVIGKITDTKKRSSKSKRKNEEESAKIIESIRREEFGLDPSVKEDGILKKQHARLGRALHCLSQELYSQDSHFLLELVQNADDNVYPCEVEPTLTFILQEGGVIVLNNEQGFSVENIKALCDVGNSTKKEPSAGYIGKKGIGFKSVFRVTDAPEIHSNGFHIKFDISEGQIGFVLPTIVPPCDIDYFTKLVSINNNEKNHSNNTCIVLPFKSKKHEQPFSVENLISMFSDLHPSLLLFLHRLKCIKFRNLLKDSLIIMRKEVVGDGIVNVSFGEQKMTWFVKSSKLQSNHIRHDVQTTEISMALMLKQDSDDGNGNYIPKLEHQPVFAFLPLRSYGLKFIIQADFILPSSREEVDGDSPWNQWLLSEFPNLFVSAERSFCSLFEKNPAKGISVFMSFVPLGGEVHGFFSCLPRMIISKLHTSNCLLLEGNNNNEWVPPCKVLRNWTEQIRDLLPDSLIKEHLGVGYLNKDTVLSDSLARALGIEECGPKILVQVITSLCRTGELKSMGVNWLSSWLNVLYLMLINVSDHSDVVNTLVQLPFILLSDGKYASIQEGTIWLHTDKVVDSEHGLEAFGNLYPKLRIVNSALFNNFHFENITQMLFKLGVQKLSAHEVLKVHILPAIADVAESTELMTEYLSFIMFHLDSSCQDCIPERESLLSQVHNTAYVSTNLGYKRLFDVPIHFSKEFGNQIDMKKLIHGTDMQWFEIDNSYLKYSNGSKSKWRKFLQELGVTDFVQIMKTEKPITDIPHNILKNMMLDDDCVISSGSIVKDWESHELTQLLSHVGLNGDMDKGKYLLEVLDTLWDDYFRDKVTGFCSVNGQNKPFKSSIIRTLDSVEWLASSMDDQLHFSKDLFHDCDTVRAILGDNAPYAVPKVNNLKLLNDIGFKTTVTLDDALSVLEVWRTSKKPFTASISQMSKFYTYIWNEMSNSRQKITDKLNSQPFIFIPHSLNSTQELVSGLFLSPHEVFWHDSTGSMAQIKSTGSQFDHRHVSKMLHNVYPGLHYFFVNEFGVAENPPLLGYLHSLLQLSTTILPSQTDKTVFQVFQRWSDGMESGILSCEDIEYLKKSMMEKETTILPTLQDKWVSLHESFGLLCWCNDEKLKKEFKNLNNVDFLSFGDLNPQETQILHDKISVLLRNLGIPSLSEVVTREAIYYGPTDSTFKTSLLTWALPHAQRYIYTNHPNEYSKFKNQTLQIIVVENLFYRNVIKRFNIESTKRYDCNCLLQDNILYATRDSDSHSLFLELSRFLIPRNPQLHLANFLHMITAMAESGSTLDQLESFVSNSQKLSKLPSEDPPWCIAATSSPETDTPAIDPPKPTTSKKFGTSSSWPPVNWKTAPGFEYGIKTNAYNNKNEVTESNAYWTSNADWTIEENQTLNAPPIILEEKEETVKDCLDFRTPSSSSVMRDQLNVGTTVTPQQVITGRTGEHVAFKYFSEKYGEKNVKWVNEGKESGLPYDVAVEMEDSKMEYIEVKATSNGRKNWFMVSVREWQFAVEKGEEFSIAHVVLSEGKLAQITIYRNPVKLCQSGQLKLAILSSK